MERKGKEEIVQDNLECTNTPGCCLPTSGLRRRDFIKIGVFGAASIMLPSVPAFAGPFYVEGNDFLIPADKKLSPEWIKSLTERGVPDVFTKDKDELKYIGMPVGGIACGQLYLSGDGKLWLWDIFRMAYAREPDGGEFTARALGGHYAHPENALLRDKGLVKQGVAVRVTKNGVTTTRTLDSTGFKKISFRGEYPIGKVEFNDDDFPVKINLEAFSPFIPNNPEESALPATILDYTITNKTNENIAVELVGWLENSVVPFLSNAAWGNRVNTIVNTNGRVSLAYTAESVINNNARVDVVFDDFESGNYNNWTVTGTAFGTEPYPVVALARWQPLQGYQGTRFINSHNARDVASGDRTSDGAWSTAADAFTGTITSKTFVINRDYISFLISGGNHPGQTCINLIVGGQVVRTATGLNSNVMRKESFDVVEFAGLQAKIQIIDNYTGGWGNIAIDNIIFTDSANTGNLEDQHGYGSMSLTVLNTANQSIIAGLDVDYSNAETMISGLKPLNVIGSNSVKKSIGQHIVGALGSKLTLAPGASSSVKFVVSWYFPHLNQQSEGGELLALNGIKNFKRHYFKRFQSAEGVANYINANASLLIDDTKKWNATWYDSTLPYWLLDRSFMTLDCLATNTLMWFDSGKIWAWEGVECCQGTCVHVWHYAQGMARIFPQMEKWLRENVDFGTGLNPDGSIAHRDETAGSYGFTVAHDGHCGTVMRAYREHTMSSDTKFLTNNYEKIKRAIEFIIKEDKDGDGLLEGGQANTLDAAWYGPMGWISSLFLGALAAGKTMALEMGDNLFSQKCDMILQKGKANLVKELYNGEYFIHKNTRPDLINSNRGSLIDQVLGQSLSWQAGIEERAVPEKECKSALASVWKYNFAPDASLYATQHKIIKGERVYVLPGNAGTMMCTWPNGGDDLAVPGSAGWPENSPVWLGPGGYFDECMTGFEHQVASHMIFEGLIQEGLAVEKAVHERHHASKHNPYNEVECSDHYSRAMASYGVFIAVCGFKYHGPKGLISFAPKISPENFKSAFTVAEGWGTYQQARIEKMQTAKILISYGKVRLKEWRLEIDDSNVDKIVLEKNRFSIPATFKKEKNIVSVVFEEQTLNESDYLEIAITTSKIVDEKKKSKVKAYPNPVRDYFNLFATEEMSNIELFSVDGKLVQSEIVNAKETKVKVDSLQASLYLVKVYFLKSSGSEVIKIIKQ